MSDFIQKFIEGLGPWFFNHGVKIVFILIGAYVIRRFAGVIIDKIIRKAVVPDNFLSPEAEKKREDTLIVVFSGTFRVIIWLAAALMIAAEFGINIGPLLAGAGLIGLAIGMGSKSLVQDYLSGLFILLEDQYRVGEEVDLSGTKGEVIELTLRKTILKDSEEVVHYIPNGQIKKVSNLSREK